MTWNLRRFTRPEASAFAFLLVLMVACLASLDAIAGIVSVSGVTNVGVPPAGNVHPGTQPVLPTPIVFNEVVGGVAPLGGIPVDHNGAIVSASPVESTNVVNPLLVHGSIPAGTIFDSYFFHFDPTDGGTVGAHTYPLSTITFDTPIIGVELFSSGYTALDKPAGTDYVGKLEAGDAIISALGGPAVGYYPPASPTRGLEEDAMAISSLPGLYTITLAGQAFGVEIDQVRIFVAAVPEPNSAILAFAGLLGLLFLGITRVGAVRT